MENVSLSLISGDFLKEIYGDIAKPSVKSVGNALGDVFGIVFGALSYFPQKGNIYLKNNLEQYRKKLENVPADKIIPVDPQIGAPIVEKLRYTKNQEISELFTTLLANASNSEKVESVHPSFISIIEQLSPDEAKIINFLKDNDYIPYCNIDGYRHDSDGGGYYCIEKYSTLLSEKISFLIKENEVAYLNNLIRLGILRDKETLYKIGHPDYEKLREKSEYFKNEKDYVPEIFRFIKFHNSFFEITEFGKMFIKACIKN